MQSAMSGMVADTIASGVSWVGSLSPVAMLVGGISLGMLVIGAILSIVRG